MSTHKLETTMTTSAGAVVTKGQTFTEDGHESRNLVIPDSTTDQQVLINIDVSTVKSIVISSDQDVTIETNSPSAPDDTLNLKANAAYIWNSDMIDALKLTVDVTAMYVTNSSGNEAKIEIRVLFDSTP